VSQEQIDVLMLGIAFWGFALWSFVFTGLGFWMEQIEKE